MAQKITLGGISTIEDAWRAIEERTDESNLSKLKLINIESVVIKIANAAVMCGHFATRWAMRSYSRELGP